MANKERKHRWRFQRAGGFDQVELRSGADLLALGELDQKLWAALACPIAGLEFDRRTLELIDTDNDGRIRAPELIAAATWAGSVLADPDSLLEGAEELPLEALNDSPEGKRILASAKQILRNLGKPEASSITAADAGDTGHIFAQSGRNGDGVVPPSAAGDDDVRSAIEDILRIVGGDKDRSGEDGVTAATLERFFTEAEAFSAWWRAAEEAPAEVMPRGPESEAAAAALRAVKPKIDDFFTRVRLAAFDERAGAQLNRDPAEYAAFSAKLLTEPLDDIAAFPIARVEQNGTLPLERGLNPAWAGAVRAFRDAVMTPLLGERAALSEEEWHGLTARFAAHEAWRAAKAGAAVEPLGLSRVRALLSDGYRERIADLIAEDLAVRPEVEAIASVERLVRYHRDLYRLANSFVSFRDFYSRKKATFQAGTLYMDSRSCDLCIHITDAAGHAAVATRSEFYVAYCDLARKGGGEKMTIAAAFTGGDSDNLMVGRNGVFYDRRGNDWDATVTRIIDHPISVRQAFWMPYKRIARLIEEQYGKLAAARDAEVQSKAAANAPGTLAAPPSKPEEKPAAPFDIAKFAGLFAAIGIALGMVGSGLAAAATGFLRLAWWQMPLAIGAIVLLISGPSMLLAYMKLRRRNLGPMLDGAGWAVNAKAKVNIRFGRTLTQLAVLPPGAERSFKGRLDESDQPWALYLILAALLAVAAYLWQDGTLPRWLHELSTHPPAPPASQVAPAPALPHLF